MKHIVLTVACSLALTTSVVAQKHSVQTGEPHRLEARQGHLEMVNIPLEGKDLTSVLEQQLQLPSGYHLRFTDSRTGKVGSYSLYEVMYGEYILYSNQVKAGVDDKNVLKFIGHNLEFPSAPTQTTFPQAGIVDISRSLPNINMLDQYPVWYPGEKELQPSLYVRYTSSDGEHRESILDVSGNLVYTRVLDSYHHQSTNPGDSLVRMKVFAPDPLTVAQKSYGGSYSDQNDGNTGVLDPLRSTRFQYVKYENGQFFLESPYVKIVDFEAPYSTVQTTSNGRFEFSRNDPGFEQVNSFYHISMVKSYLETLGFPSLANFQIQVDAQAMNGDDNSKFSMATYPPRLHFGTGGVDDAEDADVIVHEYGHAVLFSAAPFTNYGMERRTLDEAFGDFMAMRHSRSFKTFGYTEIFNWDGHNPFWPGRSGSAPGKVYPGLSFSGIYDNTDLWADILDQITSVLGEGVALEVLLESTHGYFGNMTFTHAAQLMVNADNMLYNGQHAQSIWSAFRSRGVVQGNLMALPEEEAFADLSIRNTWGFAHGEPLEVESGIQTIHYVVTDIQGRIIDSGVWERGLHTLSGQEWNAGIYILRLESGGQTFSEKLIRY